MDVSVVKNHIKTNTFNRYYIFTGPEVYVRSAYINQISKTKNVPVKTFETFAELSKFARTVSLLSSASIYVIIDDMTFLSDEKQQDVLSDSKAFRNDIVILVYNNIDKRNKFYKRFKDEVVEFERLPDNILVDYIKRKEQHLSTQNCMRLIEACDGNLSQIYLELDKFHRYRRYLIDNDDLGYVDTDFADAYKSGLLYCPPKDAIFDFIDAVLKNKRKLAYILLQEAYDSGEFTLNLLSNLFNNAKYTLQVQSYTGHNKLTEVTGLTPFQVKLANERRDVYPDEKLTELMHLAHDAELGIKSGKIEDEVAVNYVLAQFWE